MYAKEFLEIANREDTPLGRPEAFPIAFSEDEMLFAQEVLRLNTIQAISLIEQYLQSNITEETRRILEEILQTYQNINSSPVNY